MKKTFKLVTGFGALITAALLYAGWASDIDHETLAVKYGAGTSQFITLDIGATAHYRDTGPVGATPILLLHGSNASLHTWDAWAAALSKSYRVIRVDLPGHGLTGAVTGDDYTYDGMVRFLEVFTGAMGLERFIIGGNSMGGGVSAAFTLAHPDQVTALLLVDAAGVAYTPKEPKDVPLGFTVAGLPVINKMMLKITPRSLVRQGIEQSYHDDSLITDALVDQYWLLLRHPGNRRATTLRFRAYAANPVNLEAEKIGKPTLVLWGEGDTIIPLEAGLEWHRRLPDSQLVILQNAGHNPMEEIPARSLKPVLDFLQSLTAEKPQRFPDAVTTETGQP